MTTYTQLFGGGVISPAQVSYRALTLDADVDLVWPLEAQTGEEIAAAILDVTPSGAYTITLPDARHVSPGQALVVNNLGPSTVTIANAVGDAVASLTAGSVWMLYLRDNSSQQGLWRSFQYGAAIAQAQAAALAGAGLTAVGAQLSQTVAVSTITSDPYSVTTAQRAEALVWEGALGTFNLPSASSAGSGWFTHVRNGGTGDLTLDPASSETINGDTTLRLSPGDSAILITDGTDWWTLGLGQQAIFAFDYTNISLHGLGTPMSATDYTLTGSELNRTVYKFTGTLSGDMEVVVPATIQQYWIDNATTGGSYTVSIKAAGSATLIGIPRGQRGIYYCNGTAVLKADTTSGVPVPLTIAEGGTSATSATNARTNLSAAASGANADITSLSALSTPLSVAQGGTGGTSSPVAGTIGYGDGSKLAFTAAGVAGQVLQSNGAGAPVWATLAGAGTVTSINASGGTTGLTFSGGPVTASGTLTLGGTLDVGYGGTGASTAQGARLGLLPSIAAKSGQVLTVNVGATDVEWSAAGGGGGVTTIAGGTTGLTPAAATAGAVTLGGTLVIANGGTGAATAAGARGTLGAAASGGNTDITSMAGLGDGSVSAPAIGFASDTDTGLYRIGANNVGLCAASTRLFSLAAGGSAAVVVGPNTTSIGANYNTVVGASAGDSFTTTTASYNVFVGYQAGISAVSSSQCTLVGRAAGGSITGSQNSCFGTNAGSNLTTGSNNTVVGANANASAATVSNEVTLGNTSVSSLRCQVALTVLSDARDKELLGPLDEGALDFVMQVKPRRFRWNTRDGCRVGDRDIGFFAQELLEAQQASGLPLPGLVDERNPDRLEVTHEKLIPVLFAAVQALAAEVAQLREEANGRKG